MKKGLFNSNEMTIETPSLLIKGNIMAWADTMIQLSNILYISSSDVATRQFPILAGVLVLGGVWLLGNRAAALGLLALAIGLVWLYLWYQENERRKACAILTIRMNSGNNLYFTFTDKEFLKKVLNVLSAIMISKPSQAISINIMNSTISGNAQVLNDGIFG